MWAAQVMKNSIKKTSLIVVAVVAVIAGVTLGYHHQNPSPVVQRGDDASTTVDIGGQRFIRWQKPRDVSALSLQDEDGRTLTLADFRGRVVLLNLWATWCPPCRKEMPSLDRLNAKRGGQEFEVIALSIDHDPTLVKPFYREIGVKTLRGYFDQNARASAALGAFAVPATLLLDQHGREIGRALGPAEWDGPQVEALIDAALATSPTTQ